jgi:hypothetical protein
MKLLRAKHLILTVTAMFSLFVSAVSACACSHHEPVKVETTSCHSSSHEAPPAEPSKGSPHLEADCNCFVRTPVPAVFAKKDDKRTAVDEQPTDVVELPIVLAIEFEHAEPITSAFEPPQSNYQHALLASLPSRAPPRL